MAVEDALEIILGKWSDIEPLLTVSELTELASVGRVTMRGGSSWRSQAVFNVISQALPADHAARQALHAGADRGFQPDPVRALDVDLIEQAEIALASPSIAEDAEADALAEAGRAALLRRGVAGDAADAGDTQTWLSVRVDEQVLYPLFQFASTRPYRQHELVARLRPQLSADEDPWGAVAWWLTPNPWLTACPADLLGTEREGEIAYAADQLANDSW
ncbi:MAG TPA: hypothetical protein VN840_03870 [Streptosporangiaceae bacterium]|nr:hypothetical protein [Streptosporangiaceae bacterium]